MNRLSFASLFGARPQTTVMNRDALIQQYGSVFAALKHMTYSQRLQYSQGIQESYSPIDRRGSPYHGMDKGVQ